MAITIALPDDLAEQSIALALHLDLSLEALTVMALEEILDKHRRQSPADLELAQKMKIAQCGIEKYQQALIELAR
ncbi:histidine kinase (plasmid) [Picosynechococcus sp. PCC 11901]|uniref:hypothetical protein n=1 Tax=unclassified Picosynechococcus TaxID=3079910 RepID=UPI0004AB4434|nr:MULTISPECIES: hypothetical protein [unclassified Picosynechococcus]QCS47998.1 histidine kinase [Picosynechococcus sp. PCC 11901]